MLVMPDFDKSVKIAHCPGCAKVKMSPLGYFQDVEIKPERSHENGRGTKTEIEV